jgi:hypothetical protein
VIALALGGALVVLVVVGLIAGVTTGVIGSQPTTPASGQAEPGEADDVVVNFTAASGPASCDFLSRPLIDAYRGRQGCEAEYADAESQTANVESVEVNGETAVAYADGYRYDLVTEGTPPAWKIDAYTDERTIDHRAVAAALKRSIRKPGEQFSISCPSDVPLEEGRAFRCRVSGNFEGSLRLTQRDADGERQRYKGRLRGENVTIKVSGTIKVSSTG